MSSSLLLKNRGIKTGTHGWVPLFLVLAFWLNDVRLTLRPRSGSDARHLNANGGPIFQEEAGNRRNVPRRRLWLWHFHYVHLYPQCYQVITISAPNREKMKLGTTLLPILRTINFQKNCRVRNVTTLFFSKSEPLFCVRLNSYSMQSIW